MTTENNKQKDIRSTEELVEQLLLQCQEAEIFLEATTRVEPTVTFHCNPADWQRIAEIANQLEWRWCSCWGEDVEQIIHVHSLFQQKNIYLLLQTDLQYEELDLPSQTVIYPAANRPERYLKDMLGLKMSDHPDRRRWIRHKAWKKGQYPLRSNFPVAGTAEGKTLGDPQYPFFQATGGSVCEVPVGPVHAGIIEPGHFRFQVVGEEVLNLEERLGYVHKGIEKISEGRDAAGLARLAGRVSGDSTVSHSWAACQAMERAADIQIPERAQYLRAIMAERERVANHLGDIGAICNDVGFAFGQNQFSRLREQWQRQSQQLFGHRFMMDCIIPGGVNRDLPESKLASLIEIFDELRIEVISLIKDLERSNALLDRLMTTGRLEPDQASRLGVVGYVAKASGINFDIRRDIPYPPYQQHSVDVSCYRSGDVSARIKIRADEIISTLSLLSELLNNLPTGELATDWQPPAAGCSGIGIIEGWRGEIISYVRFADEGRIARFFPRDPSWLNWPAIEQLIEGNIVADFPVCNKSINGSYSGHDL